MSQIQKRMEALGVKQVDMILELRKRGITVQPPEMSSIDHHFSYLTNHTHRQYCNSIRRLNVHNLTQTQEENENGREYCYDQG